MIRTVSRPVFAAAAVCLLLSVPALAQTRIGFENYGARLSIIGPITARLAEDVKRELDGNPLTTGFQIDSKGEGDIAAARAIRDLIRARKLYTFVEGECSGACSIIFLGGATRRFMTEDAKIGFSALGSETEALKKEALVAEVSDAFVQKVMASPLVTYATPDELLDAGVVTDVIPPGDEPRF